MTTKLEHPLARRGRNASTPVTSTAAILKLAATPWSKDMTPVDAKTLGAGAKKTSKALRAAASVAIERLRKKALPETPDDVDVEAAYATMLGLPRAKRDACDALAWFWARKSAAFAVDVAVRTCALAIDTFDDVAVVTDKPLSPVMFNAHFVNMAGNQAPVQAFAGLRAVLAAVDDAAYADAKKRAAEHRKKLEPAFRCRVSFAFPTEHAWAEEDAADALARSAFPKYATPLVATELEPATARRIANALEDEHYIVPFLTTLVDIHGAGSRGVLAPLVAKKSRIVADRRALEAALGE